MFSGTSSIPTTARLNLTAQHQRRKPPIKARQPKVERLVKNKKNVLSEWRRLEVPSIFESTCTKKIYENMPELTWVDTADDPLVKKLERLKKESKSSGSFEFPRKFWIANPYAIDVDFIDEKLATFVLNIDHVENKTRAEYLQRHANYVLDADSINKLYDWLALKLYNYETNLYSITYTKYGIKTTYISRFQSVSTFIETKYVSHTWMTSYMWPEEGDVKPFSGNYNYNDGPLVDGWAKLVTLFGQNKKDLNLAVTAFVERKEKQDIRPLVGTSDELSGSFRIEDESKLLACSDDWRKLLIKPPENPLYHFPPASHYSYNPLDFPN
jgi:hypothetical protein